MRISARTASEEDEQRALMQWVERQSKMYPELSRLFHIPNGGHRNPIVAAKLKGQGVRAGVPDLLLPVPRWGCHGLWIEMKAKKGRTSQSQDDWIAYLRGQGYRVAICFGWEAAREVILEYLNPAVTYSPGVI